MSTSGKGHKSYRHRLPDERAGMTHKFVIGGHEGYITVGLYPDGKPGEVFIHMSKQGSTVSGLVDAVALLTSLCLQYNVPLELLCEKFVHSRFEPSGITGNESIRQTTSPLDYLFRWLKMKFIDDEEASDRYAAGRPIAEREPVLTQAEHISESISAMDPTVTIPEPKVEPPRTHRTRAVEHGKHIIEQLPLLEEDKSNGSDDVPLLVNGNKP